jgi:hypothetical protein
MAQQVRVRLFHWNEAEAAARAGWLTQAGFDADFDCKVEPGFVTRLQTRQPQVLVIDLSRLPSQGRAVGVYARRRKGTRSIPLVFVGGDPEKILKIRALIPDAVYTTWGAIKGAIRRALRLAPPAPVLPDPNPERWASNPLAVKLGLKPGMEVALLGAPDGFHEFVRAPEGVEFSPRWENKAKLVILFARSVDELDLLLSPVAEKLGHRRLWICWPKAASAARAGRTDLTQFVVLQSARAYSLKTSKILSIDNDWSAMRFSGSG